MLQFDHIYEFLYQELFKDFDFFHLPNGVPAIGNINLNNLIVFTSGPQTTKKILLYDQEPFIEYLVNQYIDIALIWPNRYSVNELIYNHKHKKLPYGISFSDWWMEEILVDQNRIYKKNVLVTSEISQAVDNCVNQNKIKSLYYFFHGFAALDWYRGHYALNYSKTIIRPYKYDFISMNRITNNDRSYRIYLVSKLKELGLLEHGLVSFNVTDNLFEDWQDEVADLNSKLSANARQHIEHHLTGISKLVIDRPELPGSASADIPRGNDAFWHVVTETVFYYPKLHLTEKIFKPIVSKQPFMLLAAPGNLAYLKSYGFKTFDSVIDESYDTIQDNDARIDAVTKQLAWYCNLSDREKNNIMCAVKPIVLHNFHHFYGEFRHIITRELLNNTKTLFKDLGYDDSHINYTNIHHVLTH
jgi:hypothetical protein